MVAAHRGIFSLGLLFAIGSTCWLVASLVALPVVVRPAAGTETLTLLLTPAERS